MQAVWTSPLRSSPARWLGGTLLAGGVCAAGYLLMGRGALIGAAAPGPIGEAKGIFAPARTQGEVTFTLVPVEGVEPNRSRRVSFGVPFPRGWMTDPHRLRLLGSARQEQRIHTRMLTPWRDLGTLQMVPSARAMLVQAEVSFPDTDGDFRPDPVTMTLEWGKTERSRGEDLPPVAVRSTWVPVNDDQYPSSAKVSEPPAYAAFSAEWYGQCVLKSRLLPLGTHPDFGTYDTMFRLMGETAANRVDPRVAAENKAQHLTDPEPWLFDRATTFHQLAFRTGEWKWLREAHRAAQFYAGRINARGFFDLKDEDLKYSYAEPLATDYWLTGDASNLEVVDRVNTAWRAFDMAYSGDNLERHWTERHAAFKLLAAVVGYELSGNEELGRDAKRSFDALVQLQSKPIPRAPGGGALLHSALSHGDGDKEEIVASPWMSTLLLDAVQRYYTHSADPRVGPFVMKMADFFKGPESLYWSAEYDRVRRLFPFYLAQTDKKPRPDLYEDKEHPQDVAKIFALAYFFSRVQGRANEEYLTVMSDLLKTQNESTYVDWIRPGAPAEGQTAFRVGPARKWGWWFRTTADMDWLIGESTRLKESEDADGARLTLDLSADAAQARPGREITYTLRYRNGGSAEAAGVVLRVPVFALNTKADVSAGSLSDGGKETSDDLVWRVGTVGAGSSGSVTFRLRVKPYPAQPGPRQPIAPVLVRATGYHCRSGHTVFNGCQAFNFEGASGSFCHTSLSNMLALERPASRR